MEIVVENFLIKSIYSFSCWKISSITSSFVFSEIPKETNIKKKFTFDSGENGKI